MKPGRPKAIGGVFLRFALPDRQRLTVIAKREGMALEDWIRALIDDELDKAGDGFLEPLPAKHGTYSWYVNRRCRCVLCRAAKQARQRAQRARQRIQRATQEGVSQ